MLLLREYRQMVYRNSLYHFCSHSVHLKLFQNKKLKNNFSTNIYYLYKLLTFADNQCLIY